MHFRAVFDCEKAAAVHAAFCRENFRWSARPCRDSHLQPCIAQRLSLRNRLTLGKCLASKTQRRSSWISGKKALVEHLVVPDCSPLCGLSSLRINKYAVSAVNSPRDFTCRCLPLIKDSATRRAGFVYFVHHPRLEREPVFFFPARGRSKYEASFNARANEALMTFSGC